MFFKKVRADQLPDFSLSNLRRLSDDDLVRLSTDFKEGTAQRRLADHEIRRREGRTARLALWISFLSLVLSVALPAAVSAVNRSESDVSVAFQFFEDGTAYLVASNSGSRPGSIGQVYLDYGPTGDRYVLHANPANRFVAPGASRQMSFRLPCNDDPGPQTQFAENPVPRPVAKDARLGVVIIQFDGQSETKSIPIGTLSGIEAINDRGHQCLQSMLRAKMASEVSGSKSPAPGSASQ